jgi:hypothetical protein
VVQKFLAAGSAAAVAWTRVERAVSPLVRRQAGGAAVPSAQRVKTAIHRMSKAVQVPVARRTPVAQAGTREVAAKASFSAGRKKA